MQCKLCIPKKGAQDNLKPNHNLPDMHVQPITQTIKRCCLISWYDVSFLCFINHQCSWQKPELLRIFTSFLSFVQACKLTRKVGIKVQLHHTLADWICKNKVGNRIKMASLSVTCVPFLKIFVWTFLFKYSCFVFFYAPISFQLMVHFGYIFSIRTLHEIWQSLCSFISRCLHLYEINILKCKHTFFVGPFLVG